MTTLSGYEQARRSEQDRRLAHIQQRRRELGTREAAARAAARVEELRAGCRQEGLVLVVGSPRNAVGNRYWLHKARPGLDGRPVAGEPVAGQSPGGSSLDVAEQRFAKFVLEQRVSEARRAHPAWDDKTALSHVLDEAHRARQARVLRERFGVSDARMEAARTAVERAASGQGGGR